MINVNIKGSTESQLHIWNSAQQYSLSNSSKSSFDLARACIQNESRTCILNQFIHFLVSSNLHAEPVIHVQSFVMFKSILSAYSKPALDVSYFSNKFINYHMLPSKLSLIWDRPIIIMLTEFLHTSPHQWFRLHQCQLRSALNRKVLN